MLCDFECGPTDVARTQVRFRFVSFCFLSFPFVTFRFVSFRFVSFRFVSFRFVSFRFVSFRFVLFRFVLFFLCYFVLFRVGLPVLHTHRNMTTCFAKVVWQRLQQRCGPSCLKSHSDNDLANASQPFVRCYAKVQLASCGPKFVVLPFRACDPIFVTDFWCRM